MMMSMINPQFIKRVKANLNYWLSTSQQVSDVTLTQLDKERHNLYRAVEYGLQIPETAVMSARLVHQLFPLIEKRGYWIEWQPILNLAMAACAATETSLQLCLMNQLGFLQSLEQNLDQAIATHSKVIKLAKRHEHNQTKAEAFFYLGYAYYYNHQYETSRQFAEWALTEFKRLSLTSEDKKMGAIFNLLGLLAKASGDQETAEQMFSQSIVYMRRIDELSALPNILSNRGANFLESKQYTKALADFDEAEKILESTSNVVEKLRVMINRGAVYFEQGNWHKAEEVFMKANSPYLQRMGDKYLRAFIANNLGCTPLGRN
jgi:tetratricopeptide (TPR) repeat protein